MPPGGMTDLARGLAHSQHIPVLIKHLQFSCHGHQLILAVSLLFQTDRDPLSLAHSFRNPPPDAIDANALGAEFSSSDLPGT